MADSLSIGIFGYTYPGRTSSVGSFGWLVFDEISDDFIPDHVGRALALLIEQFEDSEKLNALAAAFISPFQELEYVLYDLLIRRNIDNGFGTQLDMIGEIVGEPRNNKIDATYRKALKLRPVINKSHGEPEIVILYLKEIMSAIYIHYREEWPAKVDLSFVSALPIPSDLRIQIEAIASGGVGVILKHVNNTDSIFAFSSVDAIPEMQNTAGFSGVAFPTGGQFIGIITV